MDGEHQRQIRCSLAFVQSVTADAAAAIVAERERHGPYESLVDAGRRLWFLAREPMEWLTLAGAFDALEPNRRRTLWSLPVLHTSPGAAARKRHLPDARTVGQEVFEMVVPPLLPGNLPDFSFGERFTRQWQAVGFSAEGHPMRFHRGSVAARGILTCAELQAAQPGKRVSVAGLVLRPHRPPMPSGQVVVFLTLEDETGLAQVTVTPDRYETCGADIFGQPAIIVRGIATQQGAGMVLRAEATEALFTR
jgi:error-prone DNA polymerase